MKETEVLFLAEYLAKVALVLGIAFLIGYPLRRQVAALRHRVWIAWFVALIALPAVMTFPRWHWIPNLGSLPERAAVSAQIAGVESMPTTTTQRSPEGTSPPLKAPAVAYGFQWSDAWLAAWMIGMLVVVARTGLAWIFLSRLEGQLRPLSAQVRAVADGLLATLDIRREVSISVSDQVANAFVWGIGRPRVVLPSGYDQWSSAELDMVLRHELAHVKRWDAASLLISRLFFALNWVNPLAWIASREAMRLREEACDQMVLAAGHRQSDYAALLLSQAKLSNRLRFRPATISMAGPGTVERRIRGILSTARDAKSFDRRRQQSVAAGALAAVVVLTLSVGLAGVSRAQKSEEAEAANVAKVAALRAKLDSIIIPQLELNGTPLGDAIAFLQHRSAELDTRSDPEDRGVNFVVKDYDQTAKLPRITLKLSNVSLGDALGYITDLVHREYTVEAHAVIISGAKYGGAVRVSPPGASLTDREYSDEEKARIAANEKKLKSLMIPSVEFSNTSLKGALDFIFATATRLSKNANGAGDTDLNCILVGDPKDFESIRITLRLQNASISEVLRYTAKLAGMGYEVHPSAVVVGGRAAAGKSASIPDSRSPEERQAVIDIERKLNRIRVPTIEFNDTPLDTALQFLQHKSTELDVDTKIPRDRGVNVIINDKGDDKSYPKITLKLSNVPLAEAFRYTANLAQFEFLIEPNAVVFSRTVEE